MKILKTGIFKNDPNFVWVNMKVINSPKLSTKDKDIYFAICAFLNDSVKLFPSMGQINYSDKTIKQIAEIAKESESITKRTISKFINEGFFELQEKRSN